MTVDRLKGLVIILDGLGDRPCLALEGMTPLQHAQTPTLDRLVKISQSGIMDPLLPGLPVDTHTGVGILFGVPPDEAANICRGPIEAAGIGLDLQYGDILFRANLATLEKDPSVGFNIVDRRAGRIIEGVDTLCQSLQDIDVGDGISASLYPATHHRCVLRFRGPQLSAEISDTDPGGRSIHLGVLASRANNSNDNTSSTTADAVNLFTEVSHRILDNHAFNIDRRARQLLPANGVIIRGVGAYREFKNILSYLNLNVSVTAGESTILGLSNLFNFSTLTDPEFSSLPNTNLDKKLSMAVKSLESHDLAFIHIKGTDSAAHDRDPQGKSDFINRIDTALGRIDLHNIVVGICADHSTDSFRGEHNGDPVPILIHNPYGRTDFVEKFDEICCAQGSLGRLTAQGFLTSILDAMGWLANYTSSDMAFYRHNY